MQIIWHGHACFKIQSKINSEEITVITDPYDNKIGLRLPRNLRADIVTISHDHYDHSNVDAIKGSFSKDDPFFITKPGEYEIKNVFVYGIHSWHDKSEGKERGSNIIYIIEMEGIKLAHLGDLGHTLTNGQLERLAGVDVLMIPVGGVYTIDANEASQVISQIEPRIVIPMHYKLPGLTVKIDPVDKFCKEIGVSCEEKIDKLKITKKDLPQEEMKVVIIEKV